MKQLALKEQIHTGILDAALARTCGASRLETAHARLLRAAEGFSAAFGYDAAAAFSSPGRTELCGNHTDHQHGCVLAAAVDLDILATAAPTDSGVIRIQSEGYAPIAVSCGDLLPKPEERGTSSALVRGVAALIAERGLPPDTAGLDAYMISDIPGGSGLSSSAAFELLTGTMLNTFFEDGRLTPVELAQIGQRAENEYFGKPCGLMDQMACASGGVVGIDFLDPDRPAVQKVDADIRAAGYALCILDSDAGHADLTCEYAAITEEMKAVSEFFGKHFLRQVPADAFEAAVPQLRSAAGDRAVIRAMHFFAENERAEKQVQALQNGNFEEFLQLVRESGASSAMYLQNIVPSGQTERQELLLNIALCERILNGRGAVRVHGGGFGGTAQAFVPLELLEEFRARTEAVLGTGHCHVLSIRPVGSVQLV